MLGCVVLSSKGNNLRNFLQELFLGDEYVFHDKVRPKINPGFDKCPSFGSIILSANFTPIPVMHIPQRSSMIFSCVEGDITNYKEISEFSGITSPDYDDSTFAPAKLLVNLNKEKSEGPYKKLIKEKIQSKLVGTYACSLAYLSNNTRSNLALLCNNMELHLCIITSENFDLLLWTTNLNVLSRIKSEFNYDETIICLTSLDGLTFNPSVSLVMHPLFLTRKWLMWKPSYGSNKRGQVKNLCNWIRRQAIM